MPDALSRAPVDMPTEEDAIADRAVEDYAVRQVVAMVGADTPEDSHLVALREAAGRDNEYRQLIAAIEGNSEAMSSNEVKPYKQSMDEMSVVGGLVFLNNRIVVPASERPEILKALHATHSGVVKMKRAARKTLYWPNMARDLERDLIFLPSNRESYLSYCRG